MEGRKPFEKKAGQRRKKDDDDEEKRNKMFLQICRWCGVVGFVRTLLSIYFSKSTLMSLQAYLT